MDGLRNSWLSKTNLILLFIVLVSAVLRFSLLDDPNGLWYDEIVSYKEATMPNLIHLIFYTLKTDIHLPLYPLILHCWGKLTSFSDFSMRELSAILGTITVFISYLIGKELKSKETGLICASVFTVNSFLIFYSQEVRVYAFLMLLSSLYLLFLLKIKNDYKNKLNYVFLIVSMTLIFYSSIFSFMLCFFYFLSFTLYLIFSQHLDKKERLKCFLISNGVILLIASPIIFYLFINHMHYITQINGFYNDWSSLFVLFQNWFTPVLNGLFNNPRHYMETFMCGFNLSTFVFIVIPIVLSIGAIVYACKKDKNSFLLLSVPLLFLITEIIAVHCTNFKILPRYTSIIFPNVLILVGYGLSLINYKKYTKYIILAIFIGINLFHLILAKDSAIKITRHGYRPLGKALNSIELKDDDFIVVWNRTEILDRYVQKDLNILSLLRHFAYSSEPILEKDEYLKTLSLNTRKKLLRSFFEDSDVPGNTIYLMNVIYKYMEPNQKFIIIIDEHFDKYTQASFLKLVKDNKQYNETTYNDLLTIKALVNLKKVCYTKFKLAKKLNIEQFDIIVFKK